MWKAICENGDGSQDSGIFGREKRKEGDPVGVYRIGNPGWKKVE